MMPPLLGLAQISEMDGWFCAKTGQLVCAPDASTTIWPKGTELLQCEQTPSGHRFLDISHWDKVPEVEVGIIQQWLCSQPACGTREV